MDRRWAGPYLQVAFSRRRISRTLARDQAGAKMDKRLTQTMMPRTTTRTPPRTPPRINLRRPRRSPMLMRMLVLKISSSRMPISRMAGRRLQSRFWTCFAGNNSQRSLRLRRHSSSHFSVSRAVAGAPLDGAELHHHMPGVKDGTMIYGLRKNEVSYQGIALAIP